MINSVEYVENLSSHKRIPIVNRAQFTSVFTDEDYKSAPEYTDSYQKDIYEAKVKAIRIYIMLYPENFYTIKQQEDYLNSLPQ